MKTQHDGVTVCLVCDREPSRRGLCDADYMKFRRALNKLPAELREPFEQMAIDAGKIFPASEGRRTGVDNPFADIAEKLTATVRDSAMRVGANQKPPKTKPPTTRKPVQ